MWVLTASGHSEENETASCSGWRCRKNHYRSGWRTSEPCLSQQTRIWLCTDGPALSSRITPTPKPFHSFSSLYPSETDSFLIHMLTTSLSISADHQWASQMRRCHPPLCSLTCWWRCGETVRVDSLAPSHHIAFLAQPQAPEMKAFLFCAAAGLQGACRGPVYLCSNVIRRVCRYTTYPLHLPTFHRIPFSPLFPSAPPPLLFSIYLSPPSTSFFLLSLIIIQILALTPVDLRICLMWSRHEKRSRKVESLLF